MLVRFCLETVTETETDEVDVKPNFSVFKLSSVLKLKPLSANHKIANCYAEPENNWCPATSAIMPCT